MDVAKRRAGRAGGFSLIELVIVVVIIGIIGAIAIPRMSRGAEGAGDAALRGNLAVLRSAIDLYATEHGGKNPTNGQMTAVPCILESYSNEAGTSFQATKDTICYFGPYLRVVPPLPVGQNKGETGISTGAFTAAGNVGWLYNATTGAIIANTDATEMDVKTVLYSSY